MRSLHQVQGAGQKSPPLGRMSSVSSWAQSFLWAPTEHMPSLVPSLLENLAYLSVIALGSQPCRPALHLFSFFANFILYWSIVDRGKGELAWVWLLFYREIKCLMPERLSTSENSPPGTGALLTWSSYTARPTATGAGSAGEEGLSLTSGLIQVLVLQGLNIYLIVVPHLHLGPDIICGLKQTS